jgi:hypothetical protein
MTRFSSATSYKLSKLSEVEQRRIIIVFQLKSMTTYTPIQFATFMANICKLFFLSDQPCEDEYVIQRFGHYFCVQSQVVDVMIDTSIPWLSRNPDFGMYRLMQATDARVTHCINSLMMEVKIVSDLLSINSIFTLLIFQEIFTLR